MRSPLIVVVSCLALSSCSKHPAPTAAPPVDVVLVGAGVMSATLGTMLKELQPNLSIQMFERADSVSAESSDAMNNAGTGHSGFAELNYTPETADGGIDTHKAVDINEQFEISKQFWAYQVQKQYLGAPQTFINNVPHMSFVWGDDNIAYLHKRYDALQKENLFKGMVYTEDKDQLKKWIPLVMTGRNPQQKIAATRMEIGTDVNFGALTRSMVTHLTGTHGMTLNLRTQVEDIKRGDNGLWNVTVKNLADNKVTTVRARFVFIGAGGGALPLLDGKASVGSPPMSVPHLDTRVIDGKKALLFGPFATFSTKFLKNGSWIDMPGSINAGNVKPMFTAGVDNIPLTRYLIGQVMNTPEERLATLRDYLPEARLEDWTLVNAGQRVQIVKDDPKKGGILQFGTEVVASKDGSVTALLGASPGASTAAPIMLKVLQASAFRDQLKTPEWQAKMKEMIPSYGRKLNNDPAFANQIRQRSSAVLGLKMIALDVAAVPAVPAAAAK
jgi:malate dehydrogenase (quinone)